MTKHITLLLTLFCTLYSFSQTQEDKVSIGTNYTIKSTILNQDREVQVYLPDSYTTSKEEYPVLYILDGQWFFTNGVAIQKSLRVPKAIPEMIVVGIRNENPLRRTLFNGEKKKFTSFLKDEVIKFIDSNFRTTNERIIYGWEAASYYVSELILEENDLFQGAIITDGGYASEKLVKNFKSNKDVYLYLTNSKKDIYNLESTEEFNRILKKYNPENLLWKYELFNDEVHETLPHLAMYKGIMYYYHNYNSLVFESIEAYERAGGIPYLESYFKDRARRFGGIEEIDSKTKYALIWLAWKHDNFKYFSFFMEKFEDIFEIDIYKKAHWQNRLGQFYLKHKDYKNAIKFFERGIKDYPNSKFDKMMKEGLHEAKSKL
ncbi:alpha/beta hydrolase-fold protein [Tenacibaculum caenipelagi]|uniref:Putative alpha/beta superfamily hydrolase n=1 Tax=Tenacibaculum caenipelagi TaxID=1325435 RepID=A0A4R6TFE0_9FLAO|nr:alpha/beta hydrolase-fold protein [Tenacibaculum caenipelagi]TDQ25735.1 putative alpha/beta superfamily hydrolase [Tenacibaculum caenipelagi]